MEKEQPQNQPLSQKEQMIQLGYAPEYLIEFPDGTVVFDFDEVWMDTVLNMFAERKAKCFLQKRLIVS